MRWFILIVAVLCILGFLISSTGREFDAAGDLQGHRAKGAAFGFACVAVFFVLVFGVGLFLASRR
jgi:hypothetical protein